MPKNETEQQNQPVEAEAPQVVTAPLPAVKRDYAVYLDGYLAKLRAPKTDDPAKAKDLEFTPSDLPTETEARTYWAPGRSNEEALTEMNRHAVKSTEEGWYYPDDNGVQAFKKKPEGHKGKLGTLYYLPGQEKIALEQAKRQGIAE